MYSYIFVRRLTNSGWHCQDGDEYGLMRDKADTVRLSSLSQQRNVHGQLFGYSIHNEHSCAIERSSFFLKNMFRNLQYGGNFITLGQIFFPSIHGSHERDH